MTRSLTPYGRKTICPFPALSKRTATKDVFVRYAGLASAPLFSVEALTILVVDNAAAVVMVGSAFQGLVRASAGLRRGVVSFLARIRIQHSGDFVEQFIGTKRFRDTFQSPIITPGVS